MIDTYQKLVPYVDDIKERNNRSVSSLVIIKDGSIIFSGLVHGEKTLYNKLIGDTIHIRIVSPILLIYQCFEGFSAILGTQIRYAKTVANCITNYVETFKRKKISKGFR